MCWPEGLAIWNSAVIVSVEQPHTSARNSWPAIVVGLTLLTDRVRINLKGEPAAIVDVTPTAVSELELTSGSRVWRQPRRRIWRFTAPTFQRVNGSLSTPDR